MSGLFSKLKGAALSGSGPTSANPSFSKKDTESDAEVSIMVKMLQNIGPEIRKDGSDKFFGMENFGNTCYCNSIVQALYYSVPFREHVLSYPQPSTSSIPNNITKSVPSTRNSAQNGFTTMSSTKQKSISGTDMTKKKTNLNASQATSTVTGQRPEDNPNSPEYKKKQALMNGPVLELTYENSKSYGMEESTYTALKDIFIALIESKSRTGVLSPQRFLEIFKRENEMFRTSMHQDAHEFYGLVLNSVISNVDEKAQEVKSNLPVEDATEKPVEAHSPPIVNNSYQGDKTKTTSTGWVHEIFEGVLTSETKCLTCETVSQRDETFLDLSIDLDEHSSVTSCLRKFSAEEMLCERNKFHCDNCGGLQEAERRMKIKRLPKILALHLKRFKYTEDMTRLQKLFHRVVYPYHLRMFNTTDDAEDPDRLYELYAVVVHIGGNAYHGHYVSVIKTQDYGWLLFDDEMVEPVDKHYVQNFFGDKPGMACAYVLFYQETSQEPEELFKSSYSCRQKSDVDLANLVSKTNSEFSPKSKSLDTGIKLEQNGEARFPDDNASIFAPGSINTNTLVPESQISPLSTQPPCILPVLDSDTKIKDPPSIEKKEIEKSRKVSLKAQIKERKLQMKDAKTSQIACKNPCNLDERQAGQEVDDPLLSKVESVNGKHDKSLSIRSKQGHRSLGRKSLAFLGVMSGDSKKISVVPNKEIINHNSMECDEDYQISEKSHSKSTRDRFSLIALARKKCGASPPYKTSPGEESKDIL
ncbi:putative ubiquitin carboxyl-terminal hydrolase creB [Golovinomyces cichoracearum]|uniref:Ubiquitin carboxyl-terminal hydrolase n=1 Tax=Golovinomyces cichoracearum TaxID=62708 RepID=A0A420I5S5_9PEZI|nr:putative ubiquitin carboxyl-terminal hydrolase creB [Golovinomyces cichoracearum]